MLACCIILMRKGHIAIWSPQSLLREGYNGRSYALAASLSITYVGLPDPFKTISLSTFKMVLQPQKCKFSMTFSTVIFAG